MKRLTVVLLAILLAVLPVAAEGPGGLMLKVMALPGTTGLTLVKLFADRPSLGQGVSAEYSIVKTPDQMVAKIISGEADVAAIPTNTAAVLYNKGIAIKLAAITNWGVMYVVGRDGSVKSWKDLKGREVAVTGRGATPDILFRHFLSANGLDPEAEVAIQYFSSSIELTQLLAAGKVQLATLPEPWVTEALRKDSSLRILLDYQEEWKRLEKRRESYPQSCLVIKAQLARERPQVAAELLKQAAASSVWVNRNPAEAGRLAQEYVQISAEAAQNAIPRCNLRFAEGTVVKPEVDYYLGKLLGFDPQAVGGKLPDAGFYF